MPEVSALTYALAALVAVLMFVAGGLSLRLRDRQSQRQRGQQSEQLVGDAKREAEDLVKAARLEVQEQALLSRQKLEAEGERARQELNTRREVLDQRESGLARKVASFDEKEGRLDEKESRLDEKERRLDHRDDNLRRQQDELTAKLNDSEELKKRQQRQLEEIAGLTVEEARRRLTETIVSEARLNAAREVKRIRDETERKAKQQATKILAIAIQRYAGQHVAEESVSVVHLPSDEMKGRIIGREGRNIRAFEEATGVDVIIDDTPEAVILSTFDPVRREVAVQALQQLIKDGRIHPGRIEEVVARANLEIQDRLRELGEQACLEVGVSDVHVDMVPYIGRLAFRTSYGQNILGHAKEVAAVAGAIASELGLDPKLARRCGFLHDIGKAVDHEVDGPHAMIGGRMCRKFDENDIVVNAVEGHHQDVEPESVYTFVTAAADAVSASRPGARRDSLENYVSRLENLERIACSFEGVQKSYAIQAGREIRILVDHTLVSDDEAALLAEEVGRRVESELEYPGQIKIMVIRETRASALAR